MRFLLNLLFVNVTVKNCENPFFHTTITVTFMVKLIVNVTVIVTLQNLSIVIEARPDVGPLAIGRLVVLHAYGPW